MKKSVIAVFALVAMMFAVSANANLIGVFADEAASDCDADFGLYVTTDIYVAAVLSTVTAITAAEFLIDGLVGNAAYAIITPTWNSPLTIGDVLGDDGFSIAFTDPQVGPIVVLGSISVFVINSDWITLTGSSDIWCVVPTIGSMKLVVIDDEFVEHDALGWCFVPNCVPGGDFGDCSCMAIPTEDTSWGSVKSLY